MPLETDALLLATRACLVTGYLRLDSAYRSHAHYLALGTRLLGLGLDAVAFLEPGCEISAGPRTTVRPADLQSCWLRPWSSGVRLPAGNPDKDTRDYLIVTHEKTAWLAEAARWTDAEILVWIDFGVLHVQGVREELIEAFLRRATDAPRDRIGVASIWGPPEGAVDPERVAWHAAGSVLVVPRELAPWWHRQCQVQAFSLALSRGMLTWEVNTWAEAWRANAARVHGWRCDHDASLFTAGP